MGMTKIKVSKSEAPELEDGVYSVTCIGVKDEVLENPRFGTGEVVKLDWRFDDVVDEHGEEIVLDSMASAKLSPLSKLTLWAMACGIAIDFEDPDFEFDTNAFKGKKALATVIHKEGSDWPRISDLTQMPKAPRIRSGDVLSEFWEESRTRGYDRKDVAAVIGGDYDSLKALDREGLWNLFTLMETDVDSVPFEPAQK